MAILISVFSLGYHGKTIDFEKYSTCHRTTVAHFLNKGKWDDTSLEDILKSTVIQFIYKEALRSQKPVFCIVDDTISSGEEAEAVVPGRAGGFPEPGEGDGCYLRIPGI